MLIKCVLTNLPMSKVKVSLGSALVTASHEVYPDLPAFGNVSSDNMKDKVKKIGATRAYTIQGVWFESLCVKAGSIWEITKPRTESPASANTYEAGCAFFLY